MQKYFISVTLPPQSEFAAQSASQDPIQGADQYTDYAKKSLIPA
jgi:hypothetical protein